MTTAIPAEHMVQIGIDVGENPEGVGFYFPQDVVPAISEAIGARISELESGQKLANRFVTLSLLLSCAGSLITIISNNTVVDVVGIGVQATGVCLSLDGINKRRGMIKEQMALRMVQTMMGMDEDAS